MSAIEDMVPVIAAADVAPLQRQKWLERLYAASEADGDETKDIIRRYVASEAGGFFRGAG